MGDESITAADFKPIQIDRPKIAASFIDLTIPFPDGLSAYIRVPYPMDIGDYTQMMKIIAIWQRGLVRKDSP